MIMEPLFSGGEFVARFAINAEGAASMRALAQQLNTEANSIFEASTILESAIVAIGDGLGIYEPEILEIVLQSRNTLKANRDDILDLAQRVLQKADEIDEMIPLNEETSASIALNGEREHNSQNTAAQTQDTSSAMLKYDKNADSGGVEGALPVGWCTSNSMTAVGVSKHGQKIVTMTIGGVERSFPCTKSGMEEAYGCAKASGNQDMVARTSAMFEIEAFRESLELGNGEPGFAQLGGYHKDVKKQDPTGYESHHIPSRATQDEDGEMLPTISITHGDHAITSSFAWKQRKKYQPVFSPSISSTNYKESIIQNLEKGSAGYVDSIKHELWDLRSTTGHRYDGGVAAYLDAVIDMLSTRGIPKARSVNKMR